MKLRQLKSNKMKNNQQNGAYHSKNVSIAENLIREAKKIWMGSKDADRRFYSIMS